MKKGFTLVEMMIVVAIIAVLAGVAMPQYTKYVKKSETVEGVRFMKQIVDAELIYQSTHGDYLAVDTVAKLTTLGVTIPTHAKFKYYGVETCANGGFIITSTTGPAIQTLANAGNKEIHMIYPKAVNGSSFIKSYVDTETVAATISANKPSCP